MLLIGTHIACGAKPWSSVATHPPERNLNLGKVIRKTRDGDIGFSVRSQVVITQIYDGCTSLVVSGPEGDSCLAVLVGSESETMKRTAVLGLHVSIDAAVTQQVNEGLAGKLQGVPRKDIQRFSGKPLLQIYKLSVVPESER